jgi:hypothetical protein
MIKPDPEDDVGDPYGAPRREHDSMLRILLASYRSISEVGIW